MVAGWLPLGGGSDEVCTLPWGARGCWTEPVASCCDA
jgi:hypothetical protein